MLMGSGKLVDVVGMMDCGDSDLDTMVYRDSGRGGDGEVEGMMKALVVLGLAEVMVVKGGDDVGPGVVVVGREEGEYGGGGGERVHMIVNVGSEKE